MVKVTAVTDESSTPTDRLVNRMERPSRTEKMMTSGSKASKLFILIAAVGILFEIIVIALVASDRITVATAIPLLIIGMMAGFVPLVLAGMKKR